MRTRSLLCYSFATALSLGCGARESTPSQPHVFLISIDTLRSDRLPAYGYTGVKTPNIDEFRRDAVLFRHAYSHIPLTLPSHATMLTGTLPAENGVRDNLGFSLRADVPTIGELLKKNGYATGAAVSTFVLRGKTGIARGFDFYEDSIESTGRELNPGAVQRSGADTTEIATRWIRQNRGKPLFFMLHLFEPHTPYEPPEPYRTTYATNPYDGEIAASDAIVGKFLDDLKKLGIYEDALILLLSDHGEGLMDHGEDEHGIFLYREAIQVPLIVKLPGGRFAGRTVDAAAGLIDVFATIVEQAGGDRPGDVRSESLVRLMERERQRQIFSESYFGAIHFGWSPLHSMTDGNYHYIRAPRSELYDLRRDPGERRNIINDERRISATMRQATEPLVAEPADRQEIDPDEAAKLAALGYLGGGNAPANSARPDPKDMMPTLQEMKLAFGLFQAQRDAEAIPRLQELVREHPDMTDMWDVLSRSLERQHRNEESISAAKEALRRAPRLQHLAARIANLSLELRQFDQAAKHAELVAAQNPGEGHDLLARIYLSARDHSRAKQHAALAAHDPDYAISATLTLAQIASEQNEPRTALEHCDRVADLMKQRGTDKAQRYHFARGDALARMGRVEEAEREFRAEIGLFPDGSYAYRNLILLLLAQQRIEDARGEMFRMEENAPSPSTYVILVDTLTRIGDRSGAAFWAARARARFPNDPLVRTIRG